MTSNDFLTAERPAAQRGHAAPSAALKEYINYSRRIKPESTGQ